MWRSRRFIFVLQWRGTVMCWAIATASLVDAPHTSMYMRTCVSLLCDLGASLERRNRSCLYYDKLCHDIPTQTMVELLSYLHAPGHHGSHRNAGEAGARGAKERAQGSDHSLSSPPPVREVAQRGRQQEGTGHCKNTPTLSSFFFIRKVLIPPKQGCFPYHCKLSEIVLLCFIGGGGIS